MFNLFGGLSTTAGSSAGLDVPTRNVQVPSPPRITSPQVNIPQPDWGTGWCVDFVGEWVNPVSCSSTNADGTIVSMVSDERLCPTTAEWYVEVSVLQVACISDR